VQKAKGLRHLLFECCLHVGDNAITGDKLTYSHSHNAGSLGWKATQLDGPLAKYFRLKDPIISGLCLSSSEDINGFVQRTSFACWSPEWNFRVQEVGVGAPIDIDHVVRRAQHCRSEKREAELAAVKSVPACQLESKSCVAAPRHSNMIERYVSACLLERRSLAHNAKAALRLIGATQRLEEAHAILQATPSSDREKIQNCS